jgi:hypothetical protein
MAACFSLMWLVINLATQESPQNHVFIRYHLSRVCFNFAGHAGSKHWFEVNPGKIIELSGPMIV